ncbi:MAG: beta-ketoacyl-ACP synthase II [Thermodesulfovibrionales bacterium]|nr:beta-ketoacyl-ACP synthase II [Thermodesulfovibrionales bacterium]
MKKRVVITGVGVLSSIGIGKKAYWESLANGKSGIKRISLFDASNLRSQIAGEITDFIASDYIDVKEAREMDRACHFSIAAAEMAVKDANIILNEDAGVVVGTGLGGITTDDAQHKIFHTKGPRFVHPLAVPMAMYNASASHISMRYGLMGPGFTIATACTSGTHAIGEAYRLIKDGYTDVVLSGGTDATISEGIFSGWCALRVLSKRNDMPETSCRPFSKDRDGMVLGEGAGFVVLEELNNALRRSVPIYAEVIGYGTSYDASHITAPNAKGQAKAMGIALKNAGIHLDEVNYINSHGTGTALNDKVETETIKTVFGEKAYSIAVSSIKAMIGHTLGAAGAIGLVTCCLAMQDNIVPPTINYTEPDPECDLDYVPNNARKVELNVVMSNSFGFGGNNGVLILKRFDKEG